jgi:RimJ/RimL family protein N-acetyltransferase
VEIGWRLARAHWGFGFAQEAARECLRFGFEDAGLNKIYSFTSQWNAPSLNVMQKIGMKPAGQFEHPGIPQGNKLRTHLLYELSRNDWYKKRHIR